MKHSIANLFRQFLGAGTPKTTATPAGELHEDQLDGIAGGIGGNVPGAPPKPINVVGKPGGSGN